MSRIGIVLGAAAVVLTAGAIAVPALAGTAEDAPRAELTPQAEQAPAPEAQPKFPGDPYAGRCVYWLTGDTQLRECGR
ncbi:hypothetical protein FKR81_09275 [Lentzea tibetensis]|uniref:Uncharacterized protein n=1 Tax=Lentzea tibetensis TaxID=2591470 RepID=A0A563EXQ5_9PSEU|nr:hypothetical protein [Lentzea tibetensis]TWP52507.1 hypothetical protein FKR81_09275 [Lentzea tibetensis]